MALSGNPPQMGGLLLSTSDRWNAGVDKNYVDTYNDAVMAKYNNDYNYYLWQQQAEYNDPSSQMARARAAGLNPNVVAANVSSGNIASAPASSGRLSGNVRANEIQSANLAINAFNTALKAISEGVQATSTLSGIPDDIKTYRQLLTSSASLGNESQMLKNILNRIEMSKGLYDVGITDPEDDYNLRVGFTINEDSPYAKQINLRNELMYWKNANAQYDFDNLKPAQVEQLTKRAALLGNQIGLSSAELEWFTAMATTKVGSALMPLLVPLIKKVL